MKRNLGILVLVVFVLAACNQTQAPSISNTTYDWEVEKQLAYERLSPEDKLLADEGELFFNGGGYISTPPLLERPFQLSTQEGVVGFTCPQEVPNPTSRDNGTFYIRAASPGTASRPVLKLSATFILPPASDMNIKQDGLGGEPDEAPYLMVGGWPPLGSAEGETPAFDAGMGYDGEGWYLFIVREANTGVAQTFPYPAYVRVENENPSQPAEVDFTVTLSTDSSGQGMVTATATPLEGSNWIAQDSGAVYLDPTTGSTLVVEQPSDGINGQGIDNVLSLQVNFAVDDV